MATLLPATTTLFLQGETTPYGHAHFYSVYCISSYSLFAMKKTTSRDFLRTLTHNACPMRHHVLCASMCYVQNCEWRPGYDCSLYIARDLPPQGKSDYFGVVLGTGADRKFRKQKFGKRSQPQKTIWIYSLSHPSCCYLELACGGSPRSFEHLWSRK